MFVDARCKSVKGVSARGSPCPSQGKSSKVVIAKPTLGTSSAMSTTIEPEKAARQVVDLLRHRACGVHRDGDVGLGDVRSELERRVLLRGRLVGG